MNYIKSITALLGFSLFLFAFGSSATAQTTGGVAPPARDLIKSVSFIHEVIDSQSVQISANFVVVCDRPKAECTSAESTKILNVLDAKCLANGGKVLSHFSYLMLYSGSYKNSGVKYATVKGWVVCGGYIQ